MGTLASLLTKAYRQLDEDSTDSTVQSRVKDWINELIDEICDEKGIAGLKVSGYVDFEEDDLKKALAIASAHNTNSRVVRISKAWYEEYEYTGGAWASTGIDGRLEEVSIEHYRDLMLASDSTSTPSVFALFETDSSGNPYLYLYPPPDSDDSLDSTGKKYRVHFYAEADIGDLDDDADVVYPVGIENILLEGLRYKQAEYDQTELHRVNWHQKHFKQKVARFVVTEHQNRASYVFGRAKRKTQTSRPIGPERLS